MILYVPRSEGGSGFVGGSASGAGPDTSKRPGSAGGPGGVGAFGSTVGSSFWTEQLLEAGEQEDVISCQKAQRHKRLSCRVQLRVDRHLSSLPAGGTVL